MATHENQSDHHGNTGFLETRSYLPLSEGRLRGR